MGEASKALFASGSISWKKSKDGTGIDLDALFKDHPELKTQYQISKPGSRRFLVS